MRAYSQGIGDEILTARIADMIYLCNKNNRPEFLGFLDQRQQKLAFSVAHRQGCACFICWGGYEGAERAVAGIFPDNSELNLSEFPITALECRYRKEDRLSHRDFLGSLMALGVKRETIGDILPGEGRAVLFVLAEISAHIQANLEKISAVGVRCEPVFHPKLPQNQEFQEIRGTIASARLDCVLSCLLKLSRSKCDELIVAGLVRVEYMLCDSRSKIIQTGQTISVRGFGKFAVKEIGNPNKKGRYRFFAEKYL